MVLLAFGLRLYTIDRQDIWGDEAFSIWLSSQSLSQVVVGGADTHPPLYPFLLHVWLRLAGSSSLATRFLSAIIGTLTVPIAYGLGRRAFPVTSPPRLLGEIWGVGGLAALLVSVSPVLIYYSQETRMYGLVTLLAAASVYWAMRLIREPQSWRAWLAYFVSTLAAAYTHYYAFFVVLAENLVLIAFWLHRRQRTALVRWLVVQGGLVLAYLPWIAAQTAFLRGKASARFEEWTLATALRIVGDTFSAFGAGLAVPSAAAWIVAILFIFAIGAGLVALFRRPRPEGWLLVAYLFLPLLLAWIVNPVMPFFYARYLLLIAPAFYLLTAGGVMAWQHLWRPLAALGSVGLLFGSLLGLRGHYTDDAFLKGRYGQMMAYIQANAQPGDGLILANQLQRPIFEYYQPDGLEAYYFPKYEYSLEDPRTAQNLEVLADQHERLWLIRFGNPAEYDPDGYLPRWLATHGSKAYFDGWVDGDLALYVMTPAGVGTPAGETVADAVGDNIQHPLHADLGDEMRLLGYAISTEQAVPGDTLLLTLYWQALAPISQRYTVFTHLLDEGNQIRAQMDSEPQGGGLPTDRWVVDQIVQDNYALTIDPEAAPGTYSVEVGMYLLETLERLPVHDSETGEPMAERVLLGTVEVVAP
jgi:4-amino-4-deoxy-L-arabinose transferase-like glycosyltransferase